MNIDITKTNIDNSWFSLSIDSCLDTVLERYKKESRKEVFLDDSTIEDIEELHKKGLNYQEIVDTLDIKLHLVRRVLGVSKDGEPLKEKYNQKQLLKGQNNGIEENRKGLKRYINAAFKSHGKRKKMKANL